MAHDTRAHKFKYNGVYFFPSFSFTARPPRPCAALAGAGGESDPVSFPTSASAGAAAEDPAAALPSAANDVLDGVDRAFEGHLQDDTCSALHIDNAFVVKNQGQTYFVVKISNLKGHGFKFLAIHRFCTKCTLIGSIRRKSSDGVDDYGVGACVR